MNYYDQDRAVTLEDLHGQVFEEEIDLPSYKGTYFCLRGEWGGLCRDNSHSRACQEFNGGEYDKYRTREYLNSQEIF